MSMKNESTQAFIQWLMGLQERKGTGAPMRPDKAPGVLADLRRGLSSATEYYAWPHLVRWCDLDDNRQRIIYATVAGCFALHPENTSEGNLGTTLRRIAIQRGSSEDALKVYKSRLFRLIGCSTALELCSHLRSVVQLARSAAIPINYHQLLKDLLHWDRKARRIRLRWAAEFWRTHPGEFETIAEDSSKEQQTHQTEMKEQP